MCGGVQGLHGGQFNQSCKLFDGAILVKGLRRAQSNSLSPVLSGAVSKMSRGGAHCVLACMCV